MWCHPLQLEHVTTKQFGVLWKAGPQYLTRALANATETSVVGFGTDMKEVQPPFAKTPGILVSSALQFMYPKYVGRYERFQTNSSFRNDHWWNQGAVQCPQGGCCSDYCLIFSPSLFSSHLCKRSQYALRVLANFAIYSSDSISTPYKRGDSTLS